MFSNPTASPLTLSFTGELPRRNLTNTVPAGASICSARLEGKITTELGFPASSGDQVFTFGPGGYTAYVFDELASKWTPSEPAIKPGQAFLCRKKTPGTWVRETVKLP
jgi:hypothetical protein